jgi:hypothetical protein
MTTDNGQRTKDKGPVKAAFRPLSPVSASMKKYPDKLLKIGERKMMTNNPDKLMKTNDRERTRDEQSRLVNENEGVI